MGLRIRCVLILLWIQPWPAAHANSPRTAPEAGTESFSAQRPETLDAVQYRDGRITARFRDIAPAAAIGHIQAASGRVIHLHGTLPDDRIFKEIDHLPLLDSIRAVLADRSYLIDDDGTRITAFLLPEAGATGVDPRGPAPGANTPQSLDEFRPIGDGPIGGAGEDTDQPEDLAAGHAEGAANDLNTARLTRSLDVLNSDYRHLYQDALVDLTGIPDPQATKALVDALYRRPESVPRQRAAELLATHAVNIGFSDPEAVSALQELAEDSDGQIKQIARSTLAEMR